MNPKSKKGLGRGFDALISPDFDKTILLSSDEKVEKIPLSSLEQNPNQPRKRFDEKALDELASSIKRYGIVQPLIVSPTKNGYLVVAGERRWRAAQKAGLKTVPAIVHKRKELEQIELSIIENVQRVDLSPLEQAVSVVKLYDQFNMPYEEIAKRLGKAKSTVTNIARLVNLPDEAKNALINEKITEGHARTILSIGNDPERQSYLLKSIIKNGWSVRQAERFVLSVKAGTKENAKVRQHVATETPQTRSLSKKLGTNVSIRRMAKGGKLEISFSSEDELARIIGLF